MTVPDLLTLVGVEKRFGDAVALQPIDLRIPRGGAVGLVGESGSGKSTLSRIVVGLERPTAGRVAVDGNDFSGRLNRAQRKALGRTVQMVFQDPYGSLDRRLTVRQALEHSIRRGGRVPADLIENRVQELADQVRLPRELLSRRPRQLSGGQRQRVAIARALAPAPDLLVLDEAVSALDVSVQARILELLQEIRREAGTALLFVSHDLAVVRDVTDDVLVLHRGGVVERGRTASVLSAPSHPYTAMLVAAVPGPGWDPAEVARRRQIIDNSNH